LGGHLGGWAAEGPRASLNELELPAGRHELRLVNPALKPYRAVVTVSAGETLEHHAVLQASEPSTRAAQGEMLSEIEPPGIARDTR
jgi:hypothetical protein